MLATSDTPVALQYTTRARGRRCCSSSTDVATLVLCDSFEEKCFALCASSCVCVCVFVCLCVCVLVYLCVWGQVGWSTGCTYT